MSASPSSLASAAGASSAPSASSVAARARNNFDGLRLIAALLVVYGHQAVDETGTMGMRLVMFFSISGFLVAGSWNSDPDTRRFLARRFLRVYPAYATVIVICAALSWLIPARDMPEVSRMASRFYLSNLWFGSFDWGFFPHAYKPDMNQSLWMVPYEVNLYLAFAVVALCGRAARIAAAVAVLVLAPGTPPTVFAAGPLIDCWSLYFGGFFAFGVLLREVPRLRDPRIAGLCIVSGAVALWSGQRTAGLLLLIPSAAVWIGLQSWPVLRAAARFGDLSYGVFLWSFPVQQVTRLWLDPHLPVLLQLGVVLLQLVPIAWLSCRFIESPALRRKPRRPSGQTLDAAVVDTLAAEPRTPWPRWIRRVG